VTLLPRSLFGRLAAFLLAVLATAQLAGLAIHMHERGQILEQASGMQAAQRIAEVVRLLESLAPAERVRVAGLLSAPSMSIRLDRQATPPVTDDADSRARAALFDLFLRRSLGGEWPVEVLVASSIASPATFHKGPPWMKHHGPMAGAAQGALSFVARVRLQDGSMVTFDARQRSDTATWPYRLLASLGILLVAVLAVSFIAVRWITRPLKTLSEAAEGLGRDIHRPPIPEQGPLEVARAAKAFNTMQQRLVRYIEDRTRVLAAMSHDLKTPVTRLRLRAEMIDDPVLRAKYVSDLSELESMVAATLDYLRGLESGEAVTPVDVMALLESLRESLSPLGSIRLEGTAAPLDAQPRALRSCLANLLENALRYGRSATVALDDNAELLDIRIRDEGPGIPEEELERVFDPYYRLEPSRNRETGGTGLGLTIARNVAETHGGRLTLHNRPQGGLEARLILPRRTRTQ
jgi:signal transduction histidine kinase